MTDPLSSPPFSSSSNYYVQTDHQQQSSNHHPSSSSSPSSPKQQRRSRLFFGVCDMRTATVALNLLNIVFTAVVVVVLSLMFLLQGGPFVGKNIFHTVMTGFLTAGISAVGLYGAMNWNLNALYVSILGFVTIFVWRFVHLDWIDIIVTAVLLYPHSMLTLEMRAGILTPETFDREEYLTESGRDLVEMAHQYISPKHENAHVTTYNTGAAYVA
ncbi:hypothetical protein IV203_010924 [Nitzschia inconspicua]|uniref:Uncharacterized protein n=1 Tax=Nitzschia inconspicua TaxID=303405 RepID=A0A9K3KY74_9STRA|nr:hypothetical protein IV203_010924 [Nitzschia inconspicua]